MLSVLRPALCLVLLAVLAPFASATPSFNSAAPWNAVATFHSIGLYWKPTNGTGQPASVRFRQQGTTAWREGLELWWDERNDEYRGSLVELESNKVYEIQLKLGAGTPWTDTSASCNSAGAGECAIPATASCTEANSTQCTRTWSENFPVAANHTVTVPAGITHIVVNPTSALVPSHTTTGTTLTVAAPTGSGSYTKITGSNPIVGSTSSPNNACVEINHGTQKVLVTGLKLQDCKQWGVVFNIGSTAPGTRDIVIDDNEIVGWGHVSTPQSNVGAIHCADSSPNPATPPEGVKPHRVVVQKNNIHNPRHGSIAWVIDHPAGAQGVMFSRCGGNHVFRWNDIYSTNGNHFNDGIGGCCNFETQNDGFDDNVGFPGFDSDIYGNRISQANDDGIEAEGPNRNIRIWANYVDRVFLPIANVVTRVGPVYVWRNVSNNTARMHTPDGDADTQVRAPFIKGGNKDNAAWSGRAYYFHNTVLQPPKELCGGVQHTCGAGVSLSDVDGDLFNFVSKNNIWHIHRSGSSISAQCSLGFCEANNDLFNGRVTGGGSNPEANGWGNTASGDFSVSHPTYAAGGGPYPQASAIPGDTNNWSGDFRLQQGTKGTAPDGPRFVAPIPNFNDLDGQLHVGAQRAAQPLMKFGRAAADQTGPTAALSTTPSPASGMAPMPVTFNASGSMDGGSPITNLRLQFGDGTPDVSWTDKNQTQQHTYASGNFTAKLTITTAAGTDDVEVPVTVTPPSCAAPTASFTATPSSGPRPLTVNFDASASTAVSPAMITSYSINYGDNTGSGTGVTQSHAYTAEGQFTATLTVTDSNGCFDTETRVITVTPPGGGSATVTLMQGLNGYTGTTDVVIASYSANTNLGAQTFFDLVAEHNNSILVRFAIFQSEGGPVPNNAVITSATLSFYKYWGAAGTIKASRLKKSWNEMEATWNVAATGTSWTTAGAQSAGNDYEATPDGQGAVGDGNTDGCSGPAPWPDVCWLNISVTPGVQAFRNGAPNHGWKVAFVAGSGVSDAREMNSSENNDWPTLRPKLTITYTLPSGTTTTLMQGQNGYAGTTDVVIASYSANTNLGAQTFMDLVAEHNNSLLVRFAIFQSEGGPVPNGATITSAALSFYKYWGAAGTFKASRLKKNWGEMQATWNLATTGTSWTTAGAQSAGNDYEATPDGQGSVGDGNTDGCSGPAPWPDVCWLNINVTSGVQAFSSGAPNHGWKVAFVAGSGVSDAREMNSSENNDWPTLRPKLTVTWQ